MDETWTWLPPLKNSLLGKFSEDQVSRATSHSNKKVGLHRTPTQDVLHFISHLVHHIHHYLK